MENTTHASTTQGWRRKCFAATTHRLHIGLVILAALSVVAGQTSSSERNQRSIIPGQLRKRLEAAFIVLPFPRLCLRVGAGWGRA